LRLVSQVRDLFASFIIISPSLIGYRSDNRDYILKDIPKNIFSAFNQNIKPRLQDCPHLRLPLDTIPNQRIFVYEYLKNDMLNLVRKKGVNSCAKRQILKATLEGIAEMHVRSIVHLGIVRCRLTELLTNSLLMWLYSDIKPDNILVDYHYDSHEIVIDQVKISDFENAAYLPKGRCIKGMLPGNNDWRSPEGHFKGELNKPSDIFSFGIVVCYFFYVIAAR